MERRFPRGGPSVDLAAVAAMRSIEEFDTPHRSRRRPSRGGGVAPLLAHAVRTLLVFTLLCSQWAFAQPFDHSYGAWDALLTKHVKWLPDNKQSRVDYAAFQADRA